MLVVNSRNEMEHWALDRPKDSKKNAKWVSKSDTSIGLENTCHGRVSEATPHKGLT